MADDPVLGLAIERVETDLLVLGGCRHHLHRAGDQGELNCHGNFLRSAGPARRRRGGLGLRYRLCGFLTTRTLVGVGRGTFGLGLFCPRPALSRSACRRSLGFEAIRQQADPVQSVAKPSRPLFSIHGLAVRCLQGSNCSLASALKIFKSSSQTRARGSCESMRISRTL